MITGSRRVLDRQSTEVRYGWQLDEIAAVRAERRLWTRGVHLFAADERARCVGYRVGTGVMTSRVKVPRKLNAEVLPKRAVRRFYWLLDSHIVSTDPTKYGGQIAAESVAREFNVAPAQMWRWIREHADQSTQKAS